MPPGLVVFSLLAALYPSERIAAKPLQLSRRALSLSVGHAFVAAPVVQPSVAHAFFESRAQQLLQPLAAAQPRVAGLLREVAEIDRRRSKMPADYEDDAYVLRFTRSVLDPLVPSMAEVATSLPAVAGTSDARSPPELAADFKARVAALDVTLATPAELIVRRRVVGEGDDAASREQASDRELEELRGVSRALDEFLALAGRAKFDVSPRDDINNFSQGASVLYSKWLFRAG